MTTGDTFPITFSVPGAVANLGVYAAIFGDSGSSGPQVFLASQTGSDGNSIVATGTLTSAVTLPGADSLTIGANDGFPTGGGSLLLTQTDSYGNITAQTTVSYASFDSTSLAFSGVSGGSGSFAAGSTQVTLALAWTLSSTLAVGAVVPLLNLFPNMGSYPSAGCVTAVVNLPNPGLTNVGGIPSNSIYSGELVIFVGSNAGLQANASQELVVPTLGSNPNDTFGLFEWGLAGALTPKSGGSIDYDVSAIDQVGFPFQVTTQISNAPDAPAPPPPPFNQGVGFLQQRTDLFAGFTPYLLNQPTASAAWAFMSLAPENSLFAERITAPQDLLSFVLDNGPAFPQAPAGITGFQPVQIAPSTTASFTFGVNPESVVVQVPGSGYTSAPTLTFSPPPSGTTATGTAGISTSGAVTSVVITNVGSGYVTAPTITVSAPPAGGTQAAVAVGLAGLIFYYAVTALRLSVAVTDGGSGYASAPSVAFSAPAAGTTATGLVILGSGPTAGQVVGVFVTNPGSGYTTPPTVSFSGGGGSGATATASFVESMAGVAQQAQINEQTMAVLNWMPYPYATAYNVYRSTSADMGASVVLNSVPYSAVSLPAGTTLAAAAGSASTSVTLSTTPPTNIPLMGTLLISQGEAQSLFQYTSVSASTFTGTMFGNASFTPGAAVSLLPSFVDAGSTGTSATPPANNYGYEPLNQYFTAALQDFFDYYRSNLFEIDLAGLVSTKWTGNTVDITIDGTSYTVLQLTGEQGQYGGTYAGDTANIYLPFFSSNMASGTLPQPPSWLVNPAESPSAMVFAADGAFDTPDNTGITNPQAPLSTAPTSIVQDVMNPINAALNRGLTPRNDSGTWVNVLSPPYWAQAPLVPLTASASQTGGSLAQGTYYYAITGVNVNGDTSGQETIPGNIVTVPSTALSSSNQNSVTLTIPNTGATTFSAFNVYRGTTPGNLLKIGSVTPSTSGTTSFTDDGSSGTTPPPFLMNAPGQAVNWYAAYLHQLSVSINGFAYGTPYDDQGGFSTNVNLTYTGQTPQPPQGLTISLLPW
jgi:hypothetical protein